MAKIFLVVLLLFNLSSFGHNILTIQDDKLKYQVDTLNERSFELRTTHEALAMTYAREAMRLSKQINYESGLYESYRNIGIHQTNTAQYDSAIYYLKLGISFINDPLRLGIAKYYVGIIYNNLRDFERAKEYFGQAKELLDKSEENPFKYYIPNSLGVIEARKSNYNKALDYFMEAYKLKKDNNLTPDEEMANISLVYQFMDNFDKAKEFALGSLAISQAQQDTLGIVQTSITIGTIYSNLEKNDSAFLYLRKAYVIAMQKGYVDQAASSLIDEADLLMKLSRSEEAITLLEKVFQLPLHHASDKKPYVNNKLANYFFDRGQYSKALEYARDSYSFSNRSSMFRLAKKNALLLASIFEKNKIIDSTSYYFRKALEHEDSINVAANKAMFSDQRVRMETLEKDYEISQLLNQQKLSELRSQRVKVWSLVAVLVALIIIVVIVYQHKVVVKNNELVQLQLRAEIEQNKSDLYKQTLHMIQVNNSMEAIEAEIREALSNNYDAKLAKLLSSVKTNRSLKNEWDNFNKYFGNVHTDFLEKLSRTNTDLSTHEKKVCSLIKLNLSNREMATLLNIESRSVIMIKYRIKKKLALIEEDDLESYIQKL